MSYNLTYTSGAALATVPDGQINSTATSLTLVGKNYPGYGAFLNENFIKLLENFSNSTAPSSPTQGQLWWNSSSSLLSVYNGSAWKSISGAQAQQSEPVYKVAGDLWFDSVNQQLKVWSGAAWILIGPSFTSVTGASGAFADTISDSSLFNHVVVKFLVQNQLVAVLSKDSTAFTPYPPIAHFPVINPGFNLAKDSNYIFYADAYNAQNLGGVAASKFVRSDNSTFTSTVVIANPTGGLELRSTDTQTLYYSTTAASQYITLLSAQTNWGVKITTSPQNRNGGSIDALTIDKTSGEVLVSYSSPVQNLGLTPKQYVDLSVGGARTYADGLKAAQDTVINASYLQGNNTVANVSTIQNDLGYIAGTKGLQYQTITAGGASFASNITGLWGNVAYTVANVLNGYNPGTGYVTSLWSNVQSLQTSLSSLQGSSAKLDGTSSFTGTLKPSANNAIDIGTTNGPGVLRWRTAYSVNSDIYTMANVRVILPFTPTASPTAPTTDPQRYAASVLPVDMYGNVTLTGNLSFYQAAGVNGSQGGITSAATFWGPVSAASTILPLLDNNAASTVGSATKRWSNMYAVTFNGTATAAQYADLAENYLSDVPYPAGTVVRIGGDQEITQEMEDASADVFGVVSTNPAYLMNSELEGGVPVAQVGRVPVRVVGTVTKGQRLVSAGRGCARAALPAEITPFNIIGRALENKVTDEEGLIEAVVRLGV